MILILDYFGWKINIFSILTENKHVYKVPGWSRSEENFAYKISLRQTDKQKSKLNKSH